MERDNEDPIAVVGLSVKFPQDATSPEAFWKMLCEGRSAMTEVPADRFNIDAFYHPDPERVDAINTRNAHFVKEELAAFDAPFFGISREEASCIDPQQRSLLETTYRALESGGIAIESVAGSRTSVFTASFARDHDTLITRDTEAQSKYHLMGVTGTMLANRLSHFYDFRGPSMALDTACSSSLYCLHLACQSIRSGESTLSVVGGSNMILSPETMMMPLSNAGILSPDGRCYSFDHRANGYARGEGCAVVVLKPLSKAIEDGNVIRTIIRATGTSHDGKTPSLTAPSAAAQEALIRETYEAAGLDMADTHFFEAHGTGTAVGDPIEASIIGSVFRDSRDPDKPLIVGACKSNIGHLEGASGLAALVKTIKVLETGMIPPNVWFEKVNPAIDAEYLRIQFPRKLMPWPTEGLRRASINNFGYGGSNGHIIVDDAFHYLQQRHLRGHHLTVENPSLTQPLEPTTNGLHQSNGTGLDGLHSRHSQKLILLSAADEQGPTRQAEALQNHLIEKAQGGATMPSLDDLAYTMSEKRSRLPWKSFRMASSIEELKQDFADSLSSPVRASKSPHINFVFTGQGAQWPGMGRELLTYNVFRESLEAADRYLLELGSSWSLLTELHRDELSTKINSPGIAQPLCTCLQVALVDLLASWRITPANVIGHSSGEIAVAYCAGAISRESSWKIAYYRGHFAEQISSVKGRERTTMMAVALSESDIKAYLKRLGVASSVFVGCLNSPINTTITGLEKSIDCVKAALDEEHIFAKKLAVPLAYHSRMMAEISDEYAQSIGDIRPRKRSISKIGKAGRTAIPVVYSSVTGAKIASGEMAQAQYWIDNLVNHVDFLGALRSLISGGAFKNDTLAVFVEVGPSGALQRPILDTLNGVSSKFDAHYTSVLHRNASASTSALKMAGTLWSCGVKPDLTAINRVEDISHSRSRMLVDLPEYPFNRSQAYWLESQISRNYRFRSHGRHELLGTRAPDWNPAEPCWRNIIRVKEMPWVEDHGFNGSAIYPAGGMLVMAIEAARQISGTDRPILAYRLKHVHYLKPLLVSNATDGAQATIHLRPQPDPLHRGYPWYEFRIFGLTNTDWVELCVGSVKADPAELANYDSVGYRAGLDVGDCHQIQQRCALNVHHEQFYENLEEIGFHYGPAFRLLRGITYNKSGDASAKLHLRDWANEPYADNSQPCLIHPTTLDSMLHLPIAGFSEGGWKSVPTMMASATQEIWVSGEMMNKAGNPELISSSQVTSKGFREMECSISAIDSESGEPVVIIKRHKATATGSFEGSAMVERGLKRLCYNIGWKPDMTLLTNGEAHRYLESQFASHNTANHLSPESIDIAEALALSFVTAAQEYMPRQSYTGSQSHLNKYIEWMQETLRTAPQLDWPQSRKRSPADIVELLERTEEIDALQKLVTEIGRNLPGILDGSVNPLEVIFEGTLAEEYYKLTSQSTMSKFASYLDIHTHQYPALKFLEVGAGTGSATNEILGALTYSVGKGEEAARYAEYLYTDISPAFFEHAKERFARHSDRMRFSVLDISKDPISQGFEAGTYDVIVAASVLHATTDLKTTLSNVRKLLKPGGKLLLSEQCSMDRISDKFVFGVLPGWWYSKEEFRQWSPLVREEKWDELLQECDFSGVDLAFPDSEDPHYHNHSALICTANDLPENAFTSLPMIIVAEAYSKLQLDVTLGLEAQLRTWLNTPCEVTPLSKLHEHSVEDRLVICLIELERDLLNNMTEADFAAVKALCLTSRQILWLTKGAGLEPETPETAKVIGLARSVCSERGQQIFSTLSFETSSSAEVMVESTLRVLGKMSLNKSPFQETEYIEDNQKLYIGRAKPYGILNDEIASSVSRQTLQPQDIGSHPKKAIQLTIASPGLLDTLHYAEVDLFSKPLADDEIELEVRAASLNFKDVMIALGQIAGNKFGGDAAGIVRAAGPKSQFKPGDRVLSCSWGSFGTYLRCGPHEVQKLPDNMSFAEGAGRVTVFNTAYYSLVTVARLRKGETVLIHSGAGGVGQAAIQLAQHLGAEIFVTVGRSEKQQLLTSEYGIPANRIFSSRNTSFVEGVMSATKGRGVDVVLNSLAGELLQQSFECTAPFGRFVELGKRDINSNRGLTMTAFSRNLSFSSVDLTVLLQSNQPLLQEVMAGVMELFEKHPEEFYTPRPLHVYKASQVEDAFRYMQSGNNDGKVVVEYHEDDEVQVKPLNRSAYDFDANATYLITGGLGGIGRSIVRWMADRGAKNLLVLSRSGSTGKPSIGRFMDEMLARGIRVESPACDISNATLLQEILQSYSTVLPPIKGCIQGSMVLRDGLFENMKVHDFQAALAPKVAGSLNLHNLLPKDMDFFILLSSFAGTTGSPGQSNYAAANTYQDALARHRVARGQKCISLNLGLVLGVGYAAENASVSQTLKAAGNTGLREDQFLATLDILCDPARPLPLPEESQILLGVDTPESVRENGNHELFPWMYKPLFSNLHQIRATGAKSSTAAITEVDYLALAKAAGTADDAAEIITSGFLEKLSRTLSVPEREIDATKPAYSIGVDSLLAVEVRYWFLQQFKVDVPVFDVLKDQSIQELCNSVAKSLI